MTKVTFRMLEGEVIALFPDEIVDNSENIMSYMHVGQHSAANPELVDELLPVAPEEYSDLLKELINIGYDDLEVME